MRKFCYNILWCLDRLIAIGIVHSLVSKIHEHWLGSVVCVNDIHSLLGKKVRSVVTPFIPNRLERKQLEGLKILKSDVILFSHTLHVISWRAFFFEIIDHRHIWLSPYVHATVFLAKFWHRPPAIMQLLNGSMETEMTQNITILNSQ